MGRAQNLIGAQGDAWSWGIHGFPERFLETVWIFYPNPIWKKSQENQHFVRHAAFGELLTRIRLGGSVVIASNLPEYLEDACVLGADRWHLKAQCSPLRLGDRGADGLRVPRTHFEKKYLERGEPCWEVTLTIG